MLHNLYLRQQPYCVSTASKASRCLTTCLPHGSLIYPQQPQKLQEASQPVYLSSLNVSLLPRKSQDASLTLLYLKMPTTCMPQQPHCGSTLLPREPRKKKAN